MGTKEQKAAAEKVRTLQEQLIKVRAELDDSRTRLIDDPLNDRIAGAVITAVTKLEAINKALDHALDAQRQAETEAQRVEAKEQLTRLDDMEKRAESIKAAAYNTIDTLKKDLDELKSVANEHNSLISKYQGKRGFISKVDYKLLWQLTNQLAKLQKDKRFFENMSRPPVFVKRELTQLQKDVTAMRYRDPEKTPVNVYLIESDNGQGEPVYRVSK